MTGALVILAGVALFATFFGVLDLYNERRRRRSCRAHPAHRARTCPTA